MTTVHARVAILASSTVLCLGAVTGTAVAARIPDGPDGPSGSALQTASAPSLAGIPPPVDPATRSTRPVYDYAGAIRESVYVDTTMDTDSDGRTDVIAVDIVRPR